MTLDIIATTASLLEVPTHSHSPQPDYIVPLGNQSSSGLVAGTTSPARFPSPVYHVSHTKTGRVLQNELFNILPLLHRSHTFLPESIIGVHPDIPLASSAPHEPRLHQSRFPAYCGVLGSGA